jgi:hypothetical protein
VGDLALLVFLGLAFVSAKTKCAKCAVGFRVTHNVSQLPEGGDFEALNCQSSRNFDRSTKLDLTTEPPLLGRCCYAFVVLSFFKQVN